MGQRALEELHLPRREQDADGRPSHAARVQVHCAADGVMAVTGATPGKMNLRLEECPLSELRTVITDRSTGRVLTFRILPEQAGGSPGSRRRNSKR